MPMFQIRLPASTEPYRASGVDDRTDILLLGVSAREFAVAPVDLSRLEPCRIDAIEDWPWLDQQVLRTSRSHQVCMTCHFCRPHPGPRGCLLLACHLRQGRGARGGGLSGAGVADPGGRRGGFTDNHQIPHTETSQAS